MFSFICLLSSLLQSIPYCYAFPAVHNLLNRQVIQAVPQMYNETTRSMRSVQMFYIICFGVLLAVNGFTIFQGGCGSLTDLLFAVGLDLRQWASLQTPPRTPITA